MIKVKRSWGIVRVGNGAIFIHDEENNTYITIGRGYREIHVQVIKNDESKIFDFKYGE